MYQIMFLSGIETSLYMSILLVTILNKVLCACVLITIWISALILGHRQLHAAGAWSNAWWQIQVFLGEFALE